MLKNPHLNRLSRQLDEIVSFIANGEERLCAVRQDISGWSAAEQLDHTLKVDASILRRVAETPEPASLPKPINLAGRIILAIGWIPRGKAKSPNSLRGEPADCPALSATLASIRAQLEALTQTQIDRSKPLVPHPRFGGLTTQEALRFAVVHSEHHLKIVREILSK